MRVCQFRHDGNLDKAAAALRPPRQEIISILQPHRTLSNRQPSIQTADSLARKKPRSGTYPSFASIEIFAFRTFETGQPFSAASAYF